MVSKPEDVARDLETGPAAARLQTLLTLRNEVIGNRARKLAYLELRVVPTLLALLASSREPEPIIHCMATLGSLACGVGGERAARVVEDGALDAALGLLGHESPAVVAAALRAVKHLTASAAAGRRKVLGPAAVQRVVRLCGDGFDYGPGVFPDACDVVAQCCRGPEDQAAWLAGAAPPRADLLRALVDGLGAVRGERSSLGHESAVRGAFRAVCALCEGNDHVAGHLLGSAGFLRALWLSLRRGSADEQLDAVRVVRTLRRAAGRVTLEARHGGAGPEPALPELLRSASQILQALVVAPPPGGPEHPAGVPERVSHETARLWSASPELQESPADPAVIHALVAELQAHASSPPRARGARGQLRGALEALAALCAAGEDARRAALDARASTPLLRALDCPAPSVRAAACRCLVSLARSSAVLIQAFRDLPVLPPLVRSLHDPHPQVQEEAAAVLCNLATYHPPYKQELVAPGCLGKIAEMAAQPDGRLKRTALLFLKNLAYDAQPPIKADILSHLPWRAMLGPLLEHADAKVQESTWGVLRNLASCTGGSQGRDGERVVQAVGWDALAGHLARVTAPGGAPAASRVLEHALYLVVNISASGGASPDDGTRLLDRILESDALRNIKALLDELSAPPGALTGALWAVLNLAYDRHGAGQDPAALPRRVKRLCEMGFMEALEGARKHADPDVAQRARQAAEELSRVLRGDGAAVPRRWAPSGRGVLGFRPPFGAGGDSRGGDGPPAAGAGGGGPGPGPESPRGAPRPPSRDGRLPRGVIAYRASPGGEEAGEAPELIEDDLTEREETSPRWDSEEADEGMEWESSDGVEG